jgi:NAD(P)-dependent dehydrogenase (short-subunit alcohol dehydrogenase family)
VYKKDIKFENQAELNKDLGPMGLYGRSKLAQILFAKYLGRHLTSAHSNILANAIHPGIVETRQSTEHILEPAPILGQAMKWLPLKKDQYDGARSAMFAATMTKHTGEYICNPSIVEDGSELARNDQLGENLMKLTRDLVKEKTKDEIKDY